MYAAAAAVAICRAELILLGNLPGLRRKVFVTMPVSSLAGGQLWGRRPPQSGFGSMDFERFFAKEMAGLQAEGRYRVFADLEREAGTFPQLGSALWRDRGWQTG